MARKKTGKKRGRPTATLTDEERAEFLRVWIAGGEIRERDVTMKLHETVAPRFMDIGILLRKRADAVELEQPTAAAELLKKIEAFKEKVLDAVDASELDEWCAMWNDDPPDIQVELEALDPRDWSPARMREIGKKYIDAATRFTTITGPQDARRRLRRGPSGRLPDTADRHMALWIRSRKVNVRAVARELADRFGWPDRIDEFENHLRNALRALHGTDGGAI
jgi:hypothetical protein